MFGILAEEEVLTEQILRKGTTDEEECMIAKSYEVVEKDNIEKGIEEILTRAKTKFRTNLRANVRAKIMAKPASEDLTEEEISVIENELVDEIEDSIDIELESWKSQIESETLEALQHFEAEDYDDTNQDFDFYWEGEEELEIMFRN